MRCSVPVFAVHVEFGFGVAPAPEANTVAAGTINTVARSNRPSAFPFVWAATFVADYVCRIEQPAFCETARVD